jgi:hypothetical protein
MTANNWTYQGNNIAELPEDCVGFVYEITNTINGRMYIGKKLAKFKRSKAPLKGSDDLTMDIKRLGAENFKREILFYCKSKSELSYVEAREQFSRKVLETKDYYNGHIRVRVHGKGILK